MITSESKFSDLVNEISTKIEKTLDAKTLIHADNCFFDNILKQAKTNHQFYNDSFLNLALFSSATLVFTRHIHDNVIIAIKLLNNYLLWFNSSFNLFDNITKEDGKTYLKKLNKTIPNRILKAMRGNSEKQLRNAILDYIYEGLSPHNPAIKALGVEVYIPLFIKATADFFLLIALEYDSDCLSNYHSRDLIVWFAEQLFHYYDSQLAIITESSIIADKVKLAKQHENLMHRLSNLAIKL